MLADRVSAAIDDERIGDAEALVASMKVETPLDTAWRSYLQGLIAIHHRRHAAATGHLTHAAGLAFETAVGTPIDRGPIASAAEAGPSEPTDAEATCRHADAPSGGGGAAAAPCDGRDIPSAPDDPAGGDGGRCSAVGFTGVPNDASAEALDLAAAALQKAGLVYRRQDRPHHAYRAHLAAFSLRAVAARPEQTWETAISLGIDADLARRFAVGRMWHRAAIAYGAASAEASDRKQGMAYNNLAGSLIDSGDFADAVEAARHARDHWHRHDLGAVTAARADMNLGYALLRLGASRHDADARGAAGVLDEALTWLASAHEALLAFGVEAAADAEWCAEQRDFAQRLRASADI